MNQHNPGGIHASMPPPTPSGIPRPAPRRIARERAAPGTVNISRKRGGPGVPATFIINVGNIHIRNRISAAADYSIHYICRICGHPYDHNGIPHSQYEADRVRAGKLPIRDGETLTGPDGNIYRWNGYLWIKLP
jgi:hypothetical protein